MSSLMKWRWLFFLISAVVIMPGLLSLGLFGLKPGVDFTGGSLLELRFTQPTQAVSDQQIEQTAAAAYQVQSVQSSGAQQFVIRGATINNQLQQLVVDELGKLYGPVTVLRFETVGPILGQELVQKTVNAIILAALGIALYLGYQFKEVKFGVSAVVAMFHDTLVMLGVFSILGHWFQVEIDVLFVTALLTTLSFSVHDTIVVFDRIREFRRKQPRLSWAAAADAAVLQTISRSLNNSLTIIIMLVALLLLGGESLRLFALALLVGAITGTYSSSFTAVPILVSWQEWSQRRHQRARTI